MFDCIVIGGGCAGLTAAMYLGRASLNIVLFAGNLQDKGGLLSKTSVVENYPGFPEGIEGYDLIQNMEDQATTYGAQIINRDIVQVQFTTTPYHVTDDTGQLYEAKTIIVATGSKPRVLGLPLEEVFWGHGISSCATCDGALYRNKSIVVVGGGDSACEEALFLTRFSHVTLIHRRDSFRASAIMQQRVLSHPKITVLFNTIITQFHGTTHLQAITIETLGQSNIMPVEGLFYGLGLTPNTLLFKDQLDMDVEGYIVKSHQDEYYHTQTSRPGIFVAGDAADKRYRQAIVAAGSGCQAAMDVVDHLNS